MRPAKFIVAVALAASVASSALGAAFETSVLGVLPVDAPAGVERYIVLKPVSERPTEFQFFPVDFRLRDRDGGVDLSIVVTRSPIFDDTASFSITAGFSFATSTEGLALLKSAVVEATGEPDPRFAPLGNVQYKLYLFLTGADLNAEGFIVANLDSGTATLQSSIATTFRVDSIGFDQLRNLLHGEDTRMYFVLAQMLQYNVTMTAAPLEHAPASALADLFQPDRDLPLLPLYERQLSTTGIDNLEQSLGRVSDLALLLLGSTPAIDADTGDAGWTLNLERLNEQVPETTLTKVLPVRDVVRSVIALPNVCRDHPEAVVDVDGLGELC